MYETKIRLIGKSSILKYKYFLAKDCLRVKKLFSSEQLQF